MSFGENSIINFIFLELGHMGERALLNFLQVREYFRQKGITIELLAVADPKDEKRKRAEDLCNVMLPKPAFFQNWEDIEKKLIPNINKGIPTIVYDASGSSYHYEHLKAIDNLKKEGYPLYYFGEKPLISDEDELEDLKIFQPFHCDFTETESVVFKRLKEHLESNTYQIKSISFYRCSSMGLIKMFDPEERPGVTGGALEDKAPHDLSLLIGLSNERDWEIEKATIPYFMLAERKHLQLGASLQIPLFMTVRGSFHHSLFLNSGYDHKGLLRGDATADAAFALHLKSQKGIDCKVFTSWIGVNELDEGKALRKRLSSIMEPGKRGFGFDEENWLYTDRPSTRDGIKFKVEECRVGILEVENKQKDKLTIVANFLNRGKSKPFIFEVSAEKTKSPILLNDNEFEFRDSSLARVFKTVILSILNNDTHKSYLDKETAIRVHSLLIQARKKAFGLTPNTNLKELTSILTAEDESCNERDVKKEFQGAAKIIFEYLSTP